MNGNSCELCFRPAEILCFCKKVCLCQECIGKHLLSSDSHSHCPVVIDQEIAQLIEISLPKLQQSESEILEQAAKSQSTKLALLSILSDELCKLDDFYSTSAAQINDFIINLRKNLDSLHQNLIKTLNSTCDTTKSQLNRWILSLKTSDPITSPILSSLLSLENPSSLPQELLETTCEFPNLNLDSLIFPKVSLSIQIREISDSPRYDSYAASPDLYKSQLMNSYSSEDADQDSYTPLRFSVNTLTTSHKPQGRYKPVNLSQSPEKKQRRPTTSKTQVNNIRNSFKVSQTNLIWVDNISECLINYSVISNQVENAFLDNKEQNLEGCVWCFSNDENLILTGGILTSSRRQTLIIDCSGGRTFIATPMHNGRYHHASVCVGNFLYVMGGSNGLALKDCEKYNILANTWQKIGNLNVAREYLAACVHRGRIYVAGGESADSIETYNTVSNKFSLLRVRLPGFSKTFMASVDDQILIFHRKKVICFDSAKMSCVDFCELNEDSWWTPANHVVIGKTVTFIKKATVFRFDLEEVKLEVVASLT